MLTAISAIAVLFLAFLVVTVALTPQVMRFARTVGAVDRGGYRKVFEGAMPLLGGFGIALPFLLAAAACGLTGYILFANWQWSLSRFPGQFSLLMDFASIRHDFIAIAIGAAGIIGLGYIDDTRGLRPRYKLLGQLAVALYICLSGQIFTSLSIPFIGEVDFGANGGRLLTVLWIVGIINAFNLVDGIDGLASGIAFIATIALLALSIIQGNMLLAFMCAALAGSLLGFLFFNFPPARIFLGDTGSMFLGYALATLSLMGAQKAETAAILFAPLLALGLPVFETFVSIVRRYINGVPVFAGDNRHTHHRLLLKGFSQKRAVLTLCGAEFLLAGAAVLSALIPDGSPFAWSPYLVYFATLGALLWVAEYGRTEAVKTIVSRRQRNRILQSLGRYAAFRLTDTTTPVDRNLILELCRQELGLRHLEVVFPDDSRWCCAIHGTPPDTCERLRVKSIEDEDILIWYAFNGDADSNLRQDVSACLAAIFDGFKKAEDRPVPKPEPGDAGDPEAVHFPVEGKLGLRDHS